MSEAVFIPDGERLLPTELARGPWDPAAQHGGAPAGLLARAVEGVADGDGMHVARMTVEFLRPVPLEPLHVDAELLRPGRRVQLVGARLTAGDEEVCRATALRIRRAAGAAPPTEPDASPPAPDDIERSQFPGRFLERSFGGTAVEQRFASGSWELGPAVVWMRLAVPLVAGEEPSALVRTMAAADFGNGVSRILDWEEHLFINPDLTVYVERPLEGEWLCLDARTSVDGAGIGLAESALYDARGRLGRAVQALYVGAR